MHDPVSMRVREALGDPQGDGHNLFDAQLAAAGLALVNEILQRTAWQIFEHQERLTLELLDVVKGRDIGVVEPGGSARLIPKALAYLWRGEHGCGCELQGDAAVDFQVARLVDRGHAAFAQLFDNLVVQDGLSNQAYG